MKRYHWSRVCHIEWSRGDSSLRLGSPAAEKQWPPHSLNPQPLFFIFCSASALFPSQSRSGPHNKPCIDAQSTSFSDTVHLRGLDLKLSLHVKTHYWRVMDEAFFRVCNCNKQSMGTHVQHKSSPTLLHWHQYSVWWVLFPTLRVNTNRPVHRLEILSVQSIPKGCSCLHKTVYALQQRSLLLECRKIIYL